MTLLSHMQFPTGLSRRLQTNQFGVGISQRSMRMQEVSHPSLELVWAKNLKTSMVAFDIAQFLPSLNTDVLRWSYQKAGISPGAGEKNFFHSYLTGRKDMYQWDDSVCPGLFAEDIGVGQGSGISPVLWVFNRPL